MFHHPTLGVKSGKGVNDGGSFAACGDAERILIGG
jgi:hypothetical protein